MNSIEQRYRARTAASAASGAHAARVMPGGDTRSVTYYRPYPLTIARGQGPFLWDVDGNRYIDLLGNYTSLVHGSAYPPIVEAIARASARGTAWPARNEAQIELAELICERVASVERVRFCNSGSEAGMLAAQLSRRVTGRGQLLTARQGYHGSYDDLEADWAGEGGRAMIAEYGDAVSFESVLARHGDKIAAVFLEPILGSSGIIAPPPDFLPRVAAMDRMAARMQAEMERAAAALGLPFGIRRAGSLMNVTFEKSGGGGVHTPASRMMENFHLAALNEGLFFAPRGLIALSTVMTDDLIGEICERAAAALGDLVK